MTEHEIRDYTQRPGCAKVGYIRRKFKLNFFIKKQVRSFQSVIEVHAKETQLRKPEMTTKIGNL